MDLNLSANVFLYNDYLRRMAKLVDICDSLIRKNKDLKSKNLKLARDNHMLKNLNKNNSVLTKPIQRKNRFIGQETNSGLSRGESIGGFSNE